MPLQVFAGPSTANFDASIQLATSQTDYYGGRYSLSITILRYQGM